MATEEVMMSPEVVETIITRISDLAVWLQAIGIVAIIWVTLTIISVIIQRKRLKEIINIKRELNRIEKKINSLAKKKN